MYYQLLDIHFRKAIPPELEHPWYVMKQLRIKAIKTNIDKVIKVFNYIRVALKVIHPILCWSMSFAYRQNSNLVAV